MHIKLKINKITIISGSGLSAILNDLLKQSNANIIDVQNIYKQMEPDFSTNKLITLVIKVLNKYIPCHYKI